MAGSFAFDALDAIPESKAKEWVSVAYVHAICAQVGLNYRIAACDDGIDLEVGSNKPQFGNHRFRNLHLPLQLKATAVWEVKDNTIAFTLKQSTYDMLRSEAWPPAYLVLYTLPQARAHWVVQQHEAAEFRHRAFYLNLQGAAPLAVSGNGRRRKHKTVHVPVANRLSAVSLLRLYHGVCREALHV